MAGAGAPEGFQERPPSGGGWCPRRPGDVVQHRCAPGRSDRPGHRGRRALRSSPGAPRARVGSGQRPGGRRSSPPGTGGSCWSTRRRIRSAGRRRRTRLRLPGGSARCSEAVGGGSRRERRAMKSVGGQELHRRRRAGGGRGSAGECTSSGTEGRSRSPGEGGDRSRRTRGGAEDGVQRLAAVVAQECNGRALGAPISEAVRNAPTEANLGPGMSAGPPAL
jgi:hypothetical protein